MHEVPLQLDQGTPRILVHIEGKPHSLILDTGSNISTLRPGILHTEVRTTKSELFGVTGDDIEVRSELHVSFILNNRAYQHMFVVAELPTNAADIAGADLI